jgi:hypothetical protein
MSAKRDVQEVLGYVIGGLLFVVLIPQGLRPARIDVCAVAAKATYTN